MFGKRLFGLVSFISVLASVTLACGGGSSGGEGGGGGDTAAAAKAGSGAATLDPNKKLSAYTESDLVAQCKANDGRAATDVNASKPAYGPKTLAALCFLEGNLAVLNAQASSKSDAVAACQQARDACVAKGGPGATGASTTKAPDCEKNAQLGAAFLKDCNATPNDFSACQDERVPAVEVYYASQPDRCEIFASDDPDVATAMKPADVPLGAKCTAVVDACPTLGQLFLTSLSP